MLLCVADSQKKLGAEAPTMTKSLGSRMMLDGAALMCMMMVVITSQAKPHYNN